MNLSHSYIQMTVLIPWGNQTKSEARLDIGFQLAVSRRLRRGLAQAPMLRGKAEEAISVGKGRDGQEAREEGKAGTGGILEAKGQEGHIGLSKTDPRYGVSGPLSYPALTKFVQQLH